MSQFSEKKTSVLVSYLIWKISLNISKTFFQRKRPKRRRSQDCPIFLKQVNMKSIIKNSKHFEPVKGIKGSEVMEGRGTWALGASNA